jgi:hypothetical protein
MIFLAGALYVRAQTYGFLGANIAGVGSYQGIGDVKAGAVLYVSSGSCYTAAYPGNIAIIKDTVTNVTSTTLGCTTGVVAKTAGSTLTTTCTSFCYTNTAYDQTLSTSCTGGSGAANCIFTNYPASGSQWNQYQNPTYNVPAPNGTTRCDHYAGYGDGNYNITSMTSYNSTTGVVTVVVSPVAGGSVWVLANGYNFLKVGTITGTGTDIATISGGIYPLVAPTTTGAPSGPLQISFKVAPSLNLLTMTAGTIYQVPQTLNNTTNGYSTTSGFGPYSTPYTVLWMGAPDGYQDAGSSGGPNANNLQSDTFPSMPGSTTWGSPTSTPSRADLGMVSNASDAPNFGSIYRTVTAGSWHSVLAMFNGGSSKLCLEGICNPVSLNVAAAWGGMSYGNGTGGFGFAQCEMAFYASDVTAFANAFYANQKIRLGNF